MRISDWSSDVCSSDLLALPGVELGIAVSVLALGLVVAFSFRPPLWVAMLFTTAAALFHGHAHGAEMPETAAALSFGAGMVVATALLHVGGIDRKSTRLNSSH